MPHKPGFPDSTNIDGYRWSRERCIFFVWLQIRFHYGHPDLFDRVSAITLGGISKPCKGLHLSEDIFAGFNYVLRGGESTQVDYIQVGFIQGGPTHLGMRYPRCAPSWFGGLLLQTVLSSHCQLLHSEGPSTTDPKRWLSSKSMPDPGSRPRWRVSLVYSNKGNVAPRRTLFGNFDIECGHSDRLLQ